MKHRIQTIMRWMADQRGRYAAALGALLLWALFSNLIPQVGLIAIDSAIGSEDSNSGLASGLLRPLVEWAGGPEWLATHLWAALISLVVLTGLSGLFMYLKGRWAAIAAEKIVLKLKERLYDHIQHLPCSWHDSAATGDTVQRCTSDVETFRTFLVNQVIEIGRAICMVGLGLAVMLSIDVRMTLVATCLLPPIFLFAVIFFGKARKAFLAVDEAEGEMTTMMQENLVGIRVVRAFAQQEREIERFSEKNLRYQNLRLHWLKLLTWYWSISDLLCLLQAALVVAMGGWWLARGEVTVGMVYAFVAYAGMYLWPVRHMGRILADLGMATVAMDRMEEVLNVSDEMAETDRRPDRHATGHITVRELSFSYDGTAKALDNISLEIQPGETVAFVGPSGSGKSTLMQILMRMYDYEDGSVRLDGTELNELDRKWVRAQYGVVMQEPFLYSRSIRENIRLGRSSAGEADIKDAARTAHIHHAIESFDEGYDTVIGERGVTLSGGQRQRLAIARALLIDPSILVLDDALSAVDTKTERIIKDALTERHGRRTTILIAHRVSTLAHADRIYVLNEGRVTQVGSHDELMNEDGRYRRLWEIQNDLEDDLQELVAAQQEIER